MTHKLYLVDNKPLIATEVRDIPVVTLVNYEKWYRVYVLLPNETIISVDSGLIMDLCELTNTWGIIDHTFHPELLLAIAEYFGGMVDAVTLEVAAGRWIMENNSDLVKGMSCFLEDNVIERINNYKVNIAKKTKDGITWSQDICLSSKP